ncbi:ankyrin repeat domain-containing protein [Mucispirillum schaedleri]|uniref:ankyrin repeat domain-containing protein n=1 Tax=Mucispirillum schaedleri TaxID=248039 RepID=UPI001F572E7E|nr:ankyrin repeat domain-containing protein [Mucispirillum schaedleri]
MKKLITLSAIIIVIFSFGCKKEQTQKQLDNTSSEQVIEKTDMTQFEKSLSLFKNPQYDLLYKLIEKGINAELEDNVTIPYPSHAKRLLINDEQITIQKGATPLGIAALFCTPSLVNNLIEKGADLKTTINGNSIAAVIIQCGEAEQAGMFENYLKAVRKFEKDNPAVYENKAELYAANSIINIMGDNGEYIPVQTIMNYAVENKLNNIIPVILKYAGGINFFKNDNNNPNNLLPIVTALENNNYEAAKLFFDKTGSLFAQMYTLDGVKVSLIDYLFYNVMDEEIKKADIPVNTFFKSLINGYKQSGTGIKEIKTMLENGNLTTVLDTPLAVENGELPAGATVAHIAAAMEYHALLKAMAFYNEKTEILNIQDSNGDTPLHTAVRAGNLSTAKILLEGGAFIDKVNYNGLTPLAVVIKEYNGKNQAALVRLLLTSAGNTTSRYDLMPDDKTIEIFENAKNIKTVNDILNKYNIKTENIEARGYLLSESKRYAEKELNPQIVRIMKGGIDNQLPFAVYMYEIPPFPKDATPLIAAAIACSENTARNLILAKANTDIRITGENDLKYDAYDFADRVSKCEPVKAILKNPSSLKIDIEDLLAWDVEQPAEYNTAEEDAYTVEKNNDDSSKNENSDVELIIEEPVQ